MFRYAAILMTVLNIVGRQGAQHPSNLPILGVWSYRGTAPPGFVRAGSSMGRLTLSMQHNHLAVLVATGRHRYTASGQYIASRHELRFSMRIGKGAVRFDATLSQGNKRMVGTWYDAHGDDGGFVLVRISAPGRTSH